MTILDEGTHGTELTANAPAAVTTELVASWASDRLLRVRVGDVLTLTCTVTQPSPDLCVLHDVVPQRSSPELARLLRVAAALARAELGVKEVAALHPATWDELLAGPDIIPLHGIAHLAMLLTDDHLQLHQPNLPGNFSIVPLRDVALGDIAALSPAADRRNDSAVWDATLAGVYGPLIDVASVAIRAGEEVCAAIAVSEYRGRPLIGHCMSSHSRRGEGLGRSVLLEALHRLANAGYPECELRVVEDNWIARRLYRSVGFNPVRPPLRVSRIVSGGDDAR